tara:strand:+ start:15333 stop:16496 length:1164 start_codon:yes stop_codon:yes gene_type:complete
MRFRLRLLATTLVCHGVLGILPVKAEDSIPTPAQPVVSEGAVPAEEGTAEYPPEPGIPDTETADTAAADSATAEAGTPADTSSEAPDPAGQDVTHPSAAPADSEQIDFADRSRLWVVHRLDTLSGSLDTFFMNMLFDEQLVDQDIRGNTARISASSYRVRHELTEYKLGLGVNIVLPNTNERLNLLISSQGEDEGNEPDIIRSAERANYVAALRFIIRESRRWKIDADAGVNWALIPDPYTRIRARRPLEYGFMRFRFTQELNYYTKEGYGEKTDLRFDFLVSEQKLLRFETGASYLLNDEYFKLRYGAGLFNQVSRKFAYVVQAGATGSTEYGTTFDRYVAGIRFRRQIYKDWMFFEVHPQMIWADEYDWNHRPALLLKLEAELAE